MNDADRIRIERADDEWRKQFSKSERENLTKQGHALPDGSFPIRPGSVADLDHAVSAAPLGGAEDAVIHQHIRKHWIAAGKPKLKKMPAWLTSDGTQAAQRTRPASEVRTNIGTEVRFTSDTIEVRAGKNADELLIEGYPIVWNSPGEIAERVGPGFTEYIRPGAVTPELLANARIALLVKHNNASIPLAASWNGTIDSEIDRRGVHMVSRLDVRPRRLQHSCGGGVLGDTQQDVIRF